LLVPPFKPEPPPFLISEGISESEFRKMGAYYWENFETEVRSTKARTVLISSEIFFHLNSLPDFLRRLKGLFESVEVLAYLRNPVSHYPSGVSELMGILTPTERLLPSSWEGGNLLHTLSRLETTQELDGLHLRLFDRESLIGQNAVSDFFAVLSELTGKNLMAPGTEKPLNSALPGTYYAWLFFHSGYYEPAVGLPRRQDLRKHFLMARSVRQLINQNGPEPLSIVGTPFEFLVRRRFGVGWNRICDRYLGGQGKLDESIAENRKDLKSHLDEEHVLFKAWLRSNLDPAWTEYFDELHRKIFIDD